MTKFHISENGEPAACSAKIKCRLGGDSGTENHFNTPEEARTAFEEKMVNNTLPQKEKKAAKKQEVPTGIVTEGVYKGLKTPETIYSNNLPDFVEDKVDIVIYQKESDKLMKDGQAVWDVQKANGIDSYKDEEAQTYKKARLAQFDRISGMQKLEKDRLYKNLSYANLEGDARSIREVIESGENISKTFKSSEGNNSSQDSNAHFAGAVLNLDAKTKEKAYNLPARYATAFTDEKGDSFSAPGDKALINMATEINEKDPDFDPSKHIKRPSDSNRSYGRNGEYAKESIQKVGRNTAATNITEQYVINKFGEDGAKEFWEKGFYRDGPNRPTLTKFMKLVKNFENKE